jgi:AcrR family transcriptional regulator
MALSDDKAEVILAAALELFAERGFHGTAVPLVADKAGVGAGTIYRYFPSKEALVNAVFQKHKRALGEAILTEFPGDAPPRAQFHHFWSRISAFALEHPTELAFLELHHHRPYLDVTSRELEERVLAPAYAFIAHAQASQTLKPLEPMVLGGIVWGAFTGLVRMAKECRIALSPEIFAQAEQCCWEAIRA